MSDVDAANLRVLRAQKLAPRAIDRELPSANALRDAVKRRWELPSSVQDHLRDPIPSKVYFDWFVRSTLATFVEREYAIAIGTHPAAWWHITVDDADWLVRLVRATDENHASSPIRSRWGRGLEDLTLLSIDGARAMIFDTYEDELVTYAAPTAFFVERDRTYRAMRAMAKSTPDIRVGTDDMFSNGPRVLAETLRGTNAIRTWTDSRDDIDRALIALDTATPREPDVPARPGMYTLAIATTGPLAWVRVTASGRDWLWSLATAGQPIVVCSVDETHLLSFARPGEVALFETSAVRFS